MSYLIGERWVLYVGNGWHLCTPVLMNIYNITLKVSRLSTFVFKKFSEIKIFTIILVVKSLKGIDWNNVDPVSQMVAQHYFTIEPMYYVIRVVAFQRIKRQCTPMTVRANTGQSPYSVSILGQRRIRSTGIKLAMGCDAGPTLNR